MRPDETPDTAEGVVALDLDEAVLSRLGEGLTEVAAHAVTAVTREVPSYTGALRGRMGANIEVAVQVALAGFLALARDGGLADGSVPLAPQLEAAYDLGRGEARAGRSMDALLAAYRVGARVTWREMGRTAGAAGVDSDTLVRFAELVFAYIDELSAASIAGHTDELTTSGRVLERYRERLAKLLMTGADRDTLLEAASAAGWTVPQTLTAALLPPSQVRGALASLGPQVLVVTEDLFGGGHAEDVRSLLLVPDVHGAGRQHVRRALARREAVLGPARPWWRAKASYERAARVATLTGERTGTAVVDSEEHLVRLVLEADASALDDLRASVLAPLAGLRPGHRARLEETLRSWLLHQGRRDAVAADLHVHAQTVRYRMGQIRELLGADLDDPATVLALVVALGPPAAPGAR